jgi:hypothetical protein
MAPVDLTGQWVSVVTEDWQWRMVTPRKGDFASLPLNAEGTRVGNLWNPAEDGSCKAYGAAGIMRMPTRVRITWENDTTLRLETDAGRQTRRFHFGGVPPASTVRDLQGYSAAQWQLAASAPASGDGTAPRPWGSLKVVTTNLRPGWLRRNGVPYSENAVVTEYFDRFTDDSLDPAQGKADEWFTVTTIVEDPKYLTQPLMVSSNFKKEPEGSKWNPTACRP